MKENKKYEGKEKENILSMTSTMTSVARHELRDQCETEVIS